MERGGGGVFFVKREEDSRAGKTDQNGTIFLSNCVVNLNKIERGGRVMKEKILINKFKRVQIKKIDF